MDIPKPTITKPRREAGVAGQFAISTTVAYPGEEPRPVTFVGSAFGGPIVMVLPGNVQTFVTDADRFGAQLDVAWVEAFFAGNQ